LVFGLIVFVLIVFVFFIALVFLAAIRVALTGDFEADRLLDATLAFTGLTMGFF